MIGNKSMDQDVINSLLQSNILSPIDVHFAGLMTRLSDKGSEGLYLAAALASHRQAEGDICFDLSSMAGKKLQEEPDAPVCPKLNEWQMILNAEEVVGKPGEYRPLILDGSMIYLFRYWDYENKLMDSLKERAAHDADQVDQKRLQEGLKRLFPRTPLEQQTGRKLPSSRPS